MPQSVGRARAQPAQRSAQGPCIAAAPGVQACVCARVHARVCVCVCACVCTRAARPPRPSSLGAAVPSPLPVPPPPSPWPQRAHLSVPEVLIENLPGNLGGGRGRGKEPRNGRRGERRGRLLTAWSLQHRLRHTSSLPGHRVGQSPGDLHPLGCPSCPLCTGRIMTLALRLRFCSPPPPHRYYVSGW